MYKITNKQIIAQGFKRIEVEASLIAKKIQPGQFVMVMPEKNSEQVPLTVAEADPVRGRITFIVEEIGLSTQQLGNLQIGSPIFSIIGPLGTPIEVKKFGTVVCLGYGQGIVQALSMCRALKKAENKVIGIIGAKTRKSLILESQMRLVCHKLFVVTDDGSHEMKGSITDALKQLLKIEDIHRAYVFAAHNSLPAILQITKEKKIKTFVALYPVMIDGLGICGSSRVRIGGSEVLACIDGPVFDGHAVDFSYLNVRMNSVKG